MRAAWQLHPEFGVLCLSAELRRRLAGWLFCAVGALVAALVGLGLAIGFSLGNPSPAGIGLATMAMVMTALVVVGNAQAVRDAPALSVGFYMMLSAAATLAGLFAFVWPAARREEQFSRLRDRIEACASRKFQAREFEGSPPGIIVRGIDFRS